MLEQDERILLGVCEQGRNPPGPAPVVGQMRPPPFLMVALFAFMVALQLFGVLLVVPTGPPAWLWALNGVALTYGIACFGYWCRRAAQ